MEEHEDPNPLADKLCRVCGAPAQARYFEVIICHACKQFFHRHGNDNEDRIKCQTDGRCTITFENRHLCKACRLEKCLAVGLKPNFRPPRIHRSNHVKPEENKSLIAEIPETMEVAVSATTQAMVAVVARPIAPLNLVECDLSSLRADQWTLLSNLVHFFDERPILVNIERFVREHQRQYVPTDNNSELLPVYTDLFGSIMGSIRPFIEANRDFYLLETNNRSTLARRAIENLSPIVCGLIIHLSTIQPSSPLWNAIRVMYGEDICIRSQRLLEHFRPDIILHKLSLALFAFSTCFASWTYLDPDGNLSNITAIIKIQDIYAELIWRYLLYKYPSEQAAIRFMKLIEIFLLVLPTVVQMKSHHTQLIDSLVEQNEIAFVLDDAERACEET